MSGTWDELIQDIKSRLDIIRGNKKDIDIEIGLYPPDINIWNKVNSRLTKELTNLISDYGYEYSLVEPDNYKLEKIVCEKDAYYGSPSPLVTLFTNKNKPVMLADYDI